jgi:hypothetical protein
MADVTSSIGEIQEESALDDQDAVDIDIDVLINKFIKPIERYRSKSSPNVKMPLDSASNDIVSANPNIPQESRAHAFYRILGLPAIEPSGRFYNTGYTGKNKTTLIENNDRTFPNDINNNIPENVKNAISKRESSSRDRYGKFYTANSDSSIYSIALAVPNGTRLFMCMDKNIDALNNFDKQTVKIPERTKFIKTRYKKNDGSDIGQTYDSVEHILRPFMTDPVLSAKLKPSSGESSVMVAAPFLDKKDLEYERGKYVKRPGIELILRLRLRQQNIIQNSDTNFQQSITTYEGDISVNKKREIAAILSNTGINDVDVDRILKGTSNIELNTLDDFVKSFKGIISYYMECLETVERTSKQIIWTPLSNEGGPEFGTTITTGFVKPVAFQDSWELERRIANLEAKALFATNQLELGDGLSYGDFTIPFSQELAKTFTKQIQEEKNKRSNLEEGASSALSVIEYISGEVSGLGLIDIFAIYMAMWSVNITVLLNLIDDDAVDRLYNIKTIRTKEVIERKGKAGEAVKYYKEFEERIMSILSYADKLYVRAQGSLTDSEGGDVPRDVGTFF